MPNWTQLNKVIVPILDEDLCVTRWYINVTQPAEGLTADTTGGPLVPLRDAEGCVKGWAIRVVQVESAAPGGGD